MRGTLDEKWACRPCRGTGTIEKPIYEKLASGDKSDRPVRDTGMFTYRRCRKCRGVGYFFKVKYL